MKPFKIILVLIAFALTTATVDAARKRVSVDGPAGTYTTEDIEKEILFGREMSAIILADNPLLADKSINRYINLVGRSVLLHSNRPELEYHFALIESDKINAYAAPGGYVFITTAAFDLMENEAELAGVLAHEIAHIAGRHIVEALKIRADDTSTTRVMAKLIGGSSESAQAVFDQAVGHALDILFADGLKVEDEIDADNQGIHLTAMSGYSPLAYLRYIERVKPVIEKSKGELSSTHPPFNERLERLRGYIKQDGLASLGHFVNEQRFQQNR